MPFVRIDMMNHMPKSLQKEIADAVHSALVVTVGIPPDDRFQIVTTHTDNLIYDPGYLGIVRTDNIVMIEIHLSVGRTLEVKKALFAGIKDRLVDLDLRGEDVMIHLIETEPVNWSFGNGIAQYAERMPVHLAAQ
ncbi:MAG: tautomerase family protein [Rhizobiales bacterium PAR1]|nr:MAG: tautomerase family protein [Rhizobiales bacterium PAR1]